MSNVSARELVSVDKCKGDIRFPDDCLDTHVWRNRTRSGELCTRISPRRVSVGGSVLRRRTKEEERVSEKTTRGDLDYAFESRAARNRSVFRPELQLCLAILLKSGIISANQGRKRRFLLNTVVRLPISAHQ